MERDSARPVIILLAACVLATSAISQQPQRITKPPIAKKHIAKKPLIESCKAAPRERITAGDYVEEIEKSEVTFTPSAQDEIDFRSACNYLDTRELDRVIFALRTYSPQGKALAAQMLKDIEELIDTGNIKVNDYEAAVKTYRDWAETCSERLGILDSHMRRLGRHDTNFKRNFNKESPQICDLTQPLEERDRVYLRNAIEKSVYELEKMKTYINNLRPDSRDH